nr:GNAT family N-acetyltransferase [uncultured Lichenicoccus sp.]
MHPPRIETPRLVLDAHRLEDFEPMAAMWADPDVVRHIGGKPSSRQESWYRLLRNRGLWPILGYGIWAVRDRQTGRFVGEVGCADFQRATEPSISGTPEAGWVIAAWAQRRGFASEAVAAALAWLDRSHRFRRTICLIDSENVASLRIAANNGFQPAGAVGLDGKQVPLFSRDR